MGPSNEHITAANLKIDGVSDLDPDGRIPLEQLINGTTIRIPRWPRFPEAPQPGQPVRSSTLYIYWEQNGTETEMYKETYTYVDDKPEFTFALTPERMSVDGVAFIHYLLEGYDGNPDPSSPKKLTIDHVLTPTLKAPGFPDVNFFGYLNCVTKTPVYEKINVAIAPELTFRVKDEFVLEWQGFDSLNGSGPPLTPVYHLLKELNATDVEKGFIFEIAFVYVRPMYDSDSGVASYTIKRNGVPIAKSSKGHVKIDRIQPGESDPCGGPPQKVQSCPCSMCLGLSG